MTAASLLKYFHLAYLAKPIADRVIFRTIRKIHAGHFVVLGLDDGQLARKMLLVAQQETTRPLVRFTGIDLFESRAKGLALKQAYRMLHGLGARTQLIPGDPLAALACSANSLPDTDLLVIRADQLGESMEQAWFYVPRMLHTNSLVLVEQADGEGYEVLLRADVQRKARAVDRTRRSVARRSVARRSAA